MWCRYLTQVHDFSRVVPEVHLCADEQEGRLTPVLLDLRHPFLPHVVIRVRVDDAEADQEDVSVGVGNQTQPAMVFLDILAKPKPVVVLLAGGVEELDDILLVLDLHRHCVVVKHLNMKISDDWGHLGYLSGHCDCY